MLEILKSNKKTFLIIAIVIFFCIIALFGMFLLPKEDTVLISSNIYSEIKYDGGSVNGVLSGEGTLKTGDGRIKMRGTFANNELQKGTIVTIEDGTKVTRTGSFDNYDLINGEMIIEEGNLYILKKGDFQNSFLNGSGHISIKNNGEETFSYSGKFVNDLPQYE